jgi:hypothetical protein
MAPPTVPQLKLAQAAPGKKNANRTTRELEDLVKEFRKAAQAPGIQIYLVDPEAATLSKAAFIIDDFIQKVTIRTAKSDSVFLLKEMNGLFRGKEFRARAPKLAHLSKSSLGFEYSNQERQQQVSYLRFPDQEGRDDFYVGLKVLQLTLDNMREKMSATATTMTCLSERDKMMEDIADLEDDDVEGLQNLNTLGKKPLTGVCEEDDCVPELKEEQDNEHDDEATIGI